LQNVLACFARHGLEALVADIGRPVEGHSLSIKAGSRSYLQSDLRLLHQAWNETSFEIQKLRDHPDCADEEFARTVEWEQAFLKPELNFDPHKGPQAPAIINGAKPAIAILREQGVNGQIEMAAAFDAHLMRPVSEQLMYICRIYWKNAAVWQSFRAWWPVVVFPMAMFSAQGVVGPLRYCSKRNSESSSRLFLSVTTALPWVFAMAARCCLR
jgi:hypothetical protein